MKRDIAAKRMAMAGIKMEIIADVLRIPDSEAQKLLSPMFTPKPPPPEPWAVRTRIDADVEGRRILMVLRQIFKEDRTTSFSSAAKQVAEQLGIEFNEFRCARIMKRYKIPKTYPKMKPAHAVLPCTKNPLMSSNHDWIRQKAYEDAWAIERFRCKYCRCWGWQNKQREDGIRPYRPEEQADLPKPSWRQPKINESRASSSKPFNKNQESATDEA